MEEHWNSWGDADADVGLQLEEDDPLQQSSCCDQLRVVSKTCEFSHRNCIGNFNIYLDIEGEPMAFYGANSFEHAKHGLEGEKTFLYKSKFGNWCIGTKIGKFQRGILVRSCEPDEEKGTYSCPCKIPLWQKFVDGSWVEDDTFVVKRKRKNMFM